MIEGHYRYDGKIYSVLGQCKVEGNLRDGIVCVRNGDFSIVSFKTFLENFHKCSIGYKGSIEPVRPSLSDLSDDSKDS
jgi:hypothetical protein